MGVKLMTGATGEQNIQAADDRECLAGITGLDSYVFPTGNQLKATLVDANTVTIGTGAGSLQGSRFRCATTTTVNIQSGTQGQFRHDIVGLHFSRETSGREGLEFQVLTGDPAASEGAAADPAYTAGDLLKGDAEAFMPLYRIKLSGINAADPEPLFSVLTPLATLGDFVSPSYLGGGNVSLLGCTVKADCWIVATSILIVRFSYVSGSMTSSGAIEVASDAVFTLPEYLRPKSDIRATAFTSMRFGKSVGAVVEPSGAVKLHFSTRQEIRGYGFENCACCIPLAI